MLAWWVDIDVPPSGAWAERVWKVYDVFAPLDHPEREEDRIAGEALDVYEDVADCFQQEPGDDYDDEDEIHEVESYDTRLTCYTVGPVDDDCRKCYDVYVITHDDNDPDCANIVLLIPFTSERECSVYLPLLQDLSHEDAIREALAARHPKKNAAPGSMPETASVGTPSNGDAQ